MIEYVWNAAKNQSNIEKHGIDFCDAYRIYESTIKMTLIATECYSESRWIDIAPMGEFLCLLVYTLREKQVRCISMRKASKKERRLYYEHS